MYFFCRQIPCVDDGYVDIRANLTLGLLELEHTYFKNDCNDHVEDVDWRDRL